MKPKSGLVALLVLVAGMISPAFAQNNKPLRSGNWYEDRTSGVVATSPGIMKFAQGPTDKFLNITNVSCAISALAVQTIYQIDLIGGTSSGATDLGRPYHLNTTAPPETSSGLKFYMINTQAYLKLGPGRFPSIQFWSISTGSTSFNVDCVIVGNLSDN